MLFCRTEDDSDAKIRKRFVLAKAFSIFLHIRNYTLLYMSIPIKFTIGFPGALPFQRERTKPSTPLQATASSS